MLDVARAGHAKIPRGGGAKGLKTWDPGKRRAEVHLVVRRGRRRN